MLIIGGHDYYDGAGYGVDKTIVFKRDERTVDAPLKLPSDVRDSRIGHVLRYHLILVGEKVFPLMSSGGHWWTFSDFTAYFETEPALEYLQANTSRHVLEHHEPYIRQHFNPMSDVSKKRLLDWMIDNQAANAVIENEAGQTTARLNTATLSDYHLYKIFDPWSTHMEISRFVGGVLPMSRETVEISDKSRILKAGFDVKTSFRKRKQ